MYDVSSTRLFRENQITSAIIGQLSVHSNVLVYYRHPTILPSPSYYPTIAILLSYYPSIVILLSNYPTTYYPTILLSYYPTIVLFYHRVLVKMR